MIFITIGGFSQGFKRLIEAVDNIAPDFKEEFFAQIGGSPYIPRNIKYVKYLNYTETEEHIKKAKLVISHAGGGTLVLARKHGTPLIIVPRRKKYNEHYTDHQTELCRVLYEQNRSDVFVVEDMGKLKDTVEMALHLPAKMQHTGNQGQANIIAAIKDFMRHGE